MALFLIVYLQNSVHKHKSDFFGSSVENEYLRKIEFNLVELQV